MKIDKKVEAELNIDKTADDVDGNWTLLSGVIATDSTIVFNNRLDNKNLQKQKYQKFYIFCIIPCPKSNIKSFLFNI